MIFMGLKNNNSIIEFGPINFLFLDHNYAAINNEKPKKIDFTSTVRK